MSSPVDAIIGASGPIDGTAVFQAKGFPDTLEDLLGPDADVSDWRDGSFVTLATDLQHVPPLSRTARLHRGRGALLFGRHLEREPDCPQAGGKTVLQERARLHQHAPEWHRPIAADNGWRWFRWLRFWWPASGCTFLDVLLHMGIHRRQNDCLQRRLRARAGNGLVSAWVSTVIVLAPARLCARATGLEQGTRVRMGQALLRWQILRHVGLRRRDEQTVGRGAPAHRAAVCSKRIGTPHSQLRYGHGLGSSLRGIAAMPFSGPPPVATAGVDESTSSPVRHQQPVVTASRSSSCAAAQSYDTTARPLANASGTTLPKVSVMLGNKNRSAEA